MNIKIPKSRFPIINNIEDLLPYIKDKKEIAISKRSNGTTVVCYNVEDGDTFSNDYAIECRGIVFDTLSGNIIGRPLHKFFNLGESERTRIENFNWNEVVAVWDKLDGSMITSHRVGKDIDFKTKNHLNLTLFFWQKHILRLCQIFINFVMRLVMILRQYLNILPIRNVLLLIFQKRR